MNRVIRHPAALLAVAAVWFGLGLGAAPTPAAQPTGAPSCDAYPTREEAIAAFVTDPVRHLPLLDQTVGTICPNLALAGNPAPSPSPRPEPSPVPSPAGATPTPAPTTAPAPPPTPAPTPLPATPMPSPTPTPAPQREPSGSGGGGYGGG
jgi:hypothetical protein